MNAIISRVMHCDDKRMLYVLEEEIMSCWNNLKESRFQDEAWLNELNQAIADYKYYKKSLEA